MNLDLSARSNSVPIYSLLALAWHCDVVAIPPLIPLSIINKLTTSQDSLVIRVEAL